MPNRKRNRNSEKNTDKENRTGQQQPGYQKLSDNPSNNPEESVSTRDNTANPKYSRTSVRDDEKDNSSERV